MGSFGTVTPARVRTERTERALDAVRDRLRERDAAAFVHAGSDADAAFLGVGPPDPPGAPGPGAVVVTPDRAVALVAPDPTAPADATDRDALAVRAVADPAGSVADLVAELTDGSDDAARVLAPRAVPHDVALFLDRAGYDLASTTAVADARATLGAAERDAVRALGRATGAGLETAVERLAAADAPAGKLVAGDRAADATAGDDRDGAAARPLTPDALARAVAATLARAGVTTVDCRVRAGGVDGGDPLPAGRPVVVDCRPVAPDGSRLRAAWTAVVDGDGGWTRRADLALSSAHRAARNRLAAALDGESATAAGVASAVRAELGAYGFDDPDVGVSGVGLTARDRPRGDDEVAPGAAVVVAARVTRAGDATASEDRRRDAVTRVEPLLLGGAAGPDRGDAGDGPGIERLVPLPGSLSPSRALDD